MAKTSKPKKSFVIRHWKGILNLITVLALLVLVYLSRHQLSETVHNLKHVNVLILLLIIPIEVLNYHAQVRVYQGLFAIVGSKLSYKFMMRASLELNFINHVFPSGGVTGFSYFSLRLKNSQNIRASQASLVQIMKLVLVFISFELLLVFGLIALAWAGKANGLTILVGGSLTTLLVVGTAVFAYIASSRQRIRAFLNGGTRFLNRLIHFFRPHHPETIDLSKAESSFDDIHENYKIFRAHLPELRRPLLYALLINVTELMALYAVYVAFGEYVNIGAVILAYAVANFAGVISVLPGGIGVYEGLMTATLAAGGIPASVSLPVTVMYRIINTSIQVPPGYVLYHRALKRLDQGVQGDDA